MYSLLFIRHWFFGGTVALLKRFYILFRIVRRHSLRTFKGRVLVWKGGAMSEVFNLVGELSRNSRIPTDQLSTHLTKLTNSVGKTSGTIQGQCLFTVCSGSLIYVVEYIGLVTNSNYLQQQIMVSQPCESSRFSGKFQFHRNFSSDELFQ